MEQAVYIEKERKIPITEHCDVLVIGGGPAGITAATASARFGAKTILVERYGCLGGMGSAGLVLLFDSLCDGRGKILLRGLIEETIARLRKVDGVKEPPPDIIGSSDPKLVNYWDRHGREGIGMTDLVVRYSPIVDPEMLKLVANEMVLESGAKLLLHSWAVGAMVEDQTVKGVILESKAGRTAIGAQVVIDCTGDGDIAAFAGAEYEEKDLPLGLVFRVGNVDIQRSEEYINDHPEVLSEIGKLIRKAGISKGTFGYPGCAPGNYLLSSRDSVVWFNNIYPGSACSNIDLTETEISSRKAESIIINFYRERIPGFEKAFILDTASQVGTRGTRRIRGEHYITRDELMQGTRYHDEICLCQPPYPKYKVTDPVKSIPYRALIPVKVENLLVAGRCLSTDFEALKILRIIPPCMAMGQAAGTAAAMAVEQAVAPRRIDTAALRKKLIDQEVVLEV